MDFHTADLCDAHEDRVRVLAPMLRSYGGARAAGGPVRTLKIFEDNALVREMLAEPGQGAMLVIDGGGSLRRALLGDNLAELAVKNGWAGVVVYGCIRDSAAIGRLPLGVWALATHPMKTVKRGEGQRDVPVSFGGVTFAPGMFAYADEDGVIVSDAPLV
ncbi:MULTISPECIES: ribonuclease E activity regulator RraA [Tepidiphilus]|jgi:regulator of ribonuclease activity A|uniref:4-hydroxy-4-methyl-2-oxoglutarate aldolase n=1 Tax=Tepidiphilus thermophilus TaxID=876478 RepID=A0A0K6IXS2_9PROT|nr:MULTISPECIES: ribonuclease E activity regulator RraA [Tepidiphilus]CUB07898.1 RraA famliy [Tepidiphilus thermophilus]